MPKHSLKPKAIDALRFEEKDRNSNSLYFWFWEAEGGVHSSDDLVLWLTGGVSVEVGSGYVETISVTFELTMLLLVCFPAWLL